MILSSRRRDDSEAGPPPGVWCPEFELSTETLRAIVPAESGHRSVRALVREHGETLGYVSIARPPAEVSPADLGEAARSAFGDDLRAELARRAAARAVPSPPTVSVVVCTRNRSSILTACLTGLSALRYPALEIVVVDNAPTDDSTQTVVAAAQVTDGRIRYVREPLPGLSFARNRGLAEATGTIIAYTDDDVSVDERWVDNLVRGFGTDGRTGCVTGLVCTASLTTAAEIYFDARAASWSTRCEPRTFDLDQNRVEDALYPYSAGIFGTGANFAFDRALLERLGGFDEAFGAGTLTRGGEDLDIFVRVLRAGYALQYEPSALVWHHHRADDAALVKQMYGYGTGLTAYLCKLLAQRDTRRDVLSRVPLGLRRITQIKRSTDARLDTVPAPAGALRQEMWGYVTGPFLYVRARRRATALRTG